MHIHIHIHIHRGLYMYIHVYIYIYISLSLSIYIYIYTHAHQTCLEGLVPLEHGGRGHRVVYISLYNMYIYMYIQRYV